LVARQNSSTLTLGDSVGWGSFGNFNALGGGGSMDDLLAAGLYGASSGSIEGIATTGGGGNSGQAAARYQVQLKAQSGSVEEGPYLESVC
jgi:hypothetical protein